MKILIKDSSNPIIVSNTISKNNIIGLCDWINYFGGGIWIDSTSNPTIGGSLNAANNIYRNYADFGMQLYRFGEGEIINAQYNYFGNCPPIDIDDVYPLDQFDVSNCLDSMLVIVEDNKTTMLYDFILYQNYPNPFNSITVISIQLPKSSYVNVSIYNLTGQLVEQLVSEYMESGFHRIQWNAASMSSGMYLYRITAGEYSAIDKCLLLK